MSRKQNLSIIALTVSIFLMISCTSSKQSSMFRQMKKEADTLIVISPYVEILEDDFRVKTSDNDLIEKNKQIITKVTNDVLSSRYVLKNIELPEINRSELLALYKNLDSLSRENITTMQQTLLTNLKGIDNSNLAIFITCHAEYNSETKAVTYSSSYRANTLGVTPAARPISDLRLIVFNMQTDEIIFHNRYYTRNYGANSPADMEAMTRKILKDIYYK